MLQLVLRPLGRSRVLLEQHKVEGVEGKEQKCIWEEGVEEVEEVEEEGEVVEGQGQGWQEGYE